MALVLLVTSRDWPGLFDDDLVLLRALRRRGVDARPAIWDDPSVRWHSADLAVIRSVWDYTSRRDDFVAWAERVGAVVPLHNPPDVVRWNSHKGYLRDLEAQGVPIVPTVWLPAGSRADLGALLAEQRWHDAVVKPAVSAGARRTIRVRHEAPGQDHVDELLPTCDLMVQPYVQATEGPGEHSLVHVENRLVHTVRKLPALAGAAYSSSQVEAWEPDAREVALAGQVLAAVGRDLLYARVDAIVDARGTARLMELEVIEPQLFFRTCPQAAEAMADAIASRLRRPGAVS